jgi:hypothetical protein
MNEKEKFKDSRDKVTIKIFGFDKSNPYISSVGVDLSSLLA